LPRTRPVVFVEPGTPNTVAEMLGSAARIFFVSCPRPAVIWSGLFSGVGSTASSFSVFTPPHWAPPRFFFPPKARSSRAVATMKKTTKMPITSRKAQVGGAGS
jgi:hypothetical protein